MNTICSEWTCWFCADVFFLKKDRSIYIRCVWSARHSACFARNVVISRLCRPWVCKGGQFVLIIDCRWPLLLPNIYSSLDIERGRELSDPSLCVLVFLCLWGQRANLGAGFRGLKDWRSGNRRKGWLHAILRVDGRRLCSILVRSPPSNCRRPLKYVRKLPDRSESIRTRVKAADFPCQTQFPNAADIQRITHIL